ncbi:hypothetical protein Q3G72_014259 [Acer saccharum]|nr:hypothetical protein Q3G72_014259 [Acer saccharum]
MSKDEENPTVVKTTHGSEASAPSSEIQVTWYGSLLQQALVYGLAARYCLSASLLSIINKWTVMKFPYPGALTALQHFTSAAGVFLCGCSHLCSNRRNSLFAPTMAINQDVALA